jgi:hypothetical protein
VIIVLLTTRTTTSKIMSDSDGGDESDRDLDEMMYFMSGSAGTDSDDAAEDDDEALGDWNIIRDYETSIEVDLVDQHLLEVARNEVPIVLNRLKVKMFGSRVRNLHSVVPAQFLQAWMDPNLLGHVKQFINKNVSGDQWILFVQLGQILILFKE